MRVTSLLLFLPVLAGRADAQWSQDALSQSRGEAASATLGDLTFVAGGNTGVAPSARVDIWDASTQTWSTAQLSSARRNVAATAVGQYVLFAGGGFPGQGVQTVVDVYDAQSGTWSVANLSQARALAAAATVGQKAIFAGGVYGNGITSDRIDVYDAAVGPPTNPLAWSTATLSAARGEIAATVVGTRALFAGGTSGGTNVFPNVDVYNDATGTWSLMFLSQARMLTRDAALTVGDKAVFAGGQLESNMLDPMSDRVDVFDAQTFTWSTQTLSAPRGYITVAAVGNHVLMAGGAFTGAVWTDLVERFDLGTGQWLPSTTLSGPRLRMARIEEHHRAAFAGGLTSITTSTPIVDVYEPVGVNLCSATANSTGAAATIAGEGNASLTADDLVLSTNGVPNQPFLYFHGATLIAVPFGDGLRCAGGGTVRVNPAGMASGGVAVAAVTLASAGITSPGTRYFQCWYRDPAAGGAGFNTSDALEVVFTP